MLDHLIDRHDVGVLGIEVEQPDLVADVDAVVHTLLRHDGVEVERERIHGRCSDTAAGRATSEDDGVAAQVDQVARQGSTEEGAGVALRQQDVFVGGRDLGDELISVSGIEVIPGLMLPNRPASIAFLGAT